MKINLGIIKEEKGIIALYYGGVLVKNVTLNEENFNKFLHKNEVNV